MSEVAVKSILAVELAIAGDAFVDWGLVHSCMFEVAVKSILAVELAIAGDAFE